MKKMLLFIFTVLFLVIPQVSAFNLMNLTQWKVEDGGNDHWYGVNVTRNNWQDGENEASSLSI
ncbi:MAG: hypothetical protein GXO93_02060, partial [FCB group bacterium]|nr:hypothetical protein [FCB group bacterium]